MLTSQRHLFDIPRDITYFNCAYNSPLLKAALKQLHIGVDSKSHPWERTPIDFFAQADEIRQLSADNFGGNPDCYVIVPSASYGISTAARILETSIGSNDTILMIDEEFPSVVYPFKRVSEETGANIKTVKTPTDGNWTDAILNQMDTSVKVVTLSANHWSNGAYIDVLRIRKACDDMDAALVVDTTQLLGAMPFDINEIKPDFMVAAGYKWLLCPYGFSIFYVDERWHNERPLEETWIAREKAEDFANLVNYSDTYMKGARRFEVGQKCVPTVLPGAIETFKQLKVWGIDNIADTLLNTNQKIASFLSPLGFEIPDDSQRCPHMLGAKLPEDYKGNIVAALKDENIFISQRGQSLRFAPHLYNDDNDLDRLFEGIAKLLK